jgi:hypothetical protein
MPRLVYSCVLFLFAAVGIGSCHCNPKYCEGALDNDCDNLLMDAPMGCTSNEQCEWPTTVCDLTGSMMCVQCTPEQASACGGKAPACGEDHMCRACRAHSECPGSDTCLPDGSCADPGQVAYVQAGGMGASPCARETPCGTLQEGITAVDASRPYIKISSAGGVLTPGATTTIDGKAVIVLADPGARLDRMGDGVNLEVRNTGADVQIYDLEITGASGAAGDVGISMPWGGMPKLALTRVKVTNNIGGGISASSGMLTVSQSTVSGNIGVGISASSGMLVVSQSIISSNNAGGISALGARTFNITNCFIFRNGNETTANIGGVHLGGTGDMSVFAFNTVVDNEIWNTGGSSGGVVCEIPGFVASNNIIVRNFVDNDPNRGDSNTFGQCGHSTSTIASNVIGAYFVSPNSVPHNYHLKRGSTAIDQATTPSTLAVDIDGDPRPQGNARDQGADEVP